VIPLSSSGGLGGVAGYLSKLRNEHTKFQRAVLNRWKVVLQLSSFGEIWLDIYLSYEMGIQIFEGLRSTVGKW